MRQLNSYEPKPNILIEIKDWLMRLVLPASDNFRAIKLRDVYISHIDEGSNPFNSQSAPEVMKTSRALIDLVSKAIKQHADQFLVDISLGFVINTHDIPSEEAAGYFLKDLLILITENWPSSKSLKQETIQSLITKVNNDFCFHFVLIALIKSKDIQSAICLCKYIANIPISSLLFHLLYRDWDYREPSWSWMTPGFLTIFGFALYDMLEHLPDQYIQHHLENTPKSLTGLLTLLDFTDDIRMTLSLISLIVRLPKSVPHAISVLRLQSATVQENAKLYKHRLYMRECFTFETITRCAQRYISSEINSDDINAIPEYSIQYRERIQGLLFLPTILNDLNLNRNLVFLSIKSRIENINRILASNIAKAVESLNPGQILKLLDGVDPLFANMFNGLAAEITFDEKGITLLAQFMNQLIDLAENFISMRLLAISLSQLPLAFIESLLQGQPDLYSSLISRLSSKSRSWLIIEASDKGKFSLLCSLLAGQSGQNIESYFLSAALNNLPACCFENGFQSLAFRIEVLILRLFLQQKLNDAQKALCLNAFAYFNKIISPNFLKRLIHLSQHPDLIERLLAYVQQNAGDWPVDKMKSMTRFFSAQLPQRLLDPEYPHLQRIVSTMKTLFDPSSTQLPLTPITKEKPKQSIKHTASKGAREQRRLSQASHQSGAQTAKIDSLLSHLRTHFDNQRPRILLNELLDDFKICALPEENKHRKLHEAHATLARICDTLKSEVNRFYQEYQRLLQILSTKSSVSIDDLESCEAEVDSLWRKQKELLDAIETGKQSCSDYTRKYSAKRLEIKESHEKGNWRSRDRNSEPNRFRFSKGSCQSDTEEQHPDISLYVKRLDTNPCLFGFVSPVAQQWNALCAKNSAQDSHFDNHYSCK